LVSGYILTLELDGSNLGMPELAGIMTGIR